jgi:hypothetical protein
VAPPPFHVGGATDRGAAGGQGKLTSQHELAIWQPAWPTRDKQSQHR